MTDKNGGAAFPRVMERFNGTFENCDGMSLRDYFANHCPTEWMDLAMPKTVGDMRDAMIIRGILPESARKLDALKSYNGAHRRQLFVAIRYDYADAMLAARDK